MPREPKNKADKFFSMRVGKELREAFRKNAETVHGEAAASRLRTLMYNDLPASVRRELQEPHPVDAIDQSYREGKSSAGSEGGSN